MATFPLFSSVVLLGAKGFFLCANLVELVFAFGVAHPDANSGSESSDGGPRDGSSCDLFFFEGLICASEWASE